MRIRTILAAAAAPAALAAVLLGTAGQASAATTQAPRLTGSVALSAPDQWAAFGNIGGPGGGSFSYTNFDQPDTGATVASGVGSLPQHTDIPLSFNLDGTPYNHTLTVDSIHPTGQGSFTFTGHGHYSDDRYTWTATGSVTGEALTMHLVYTGLNPGYSVDASATINPDGTLTGTATSSDPSQSFTLTGSGAFQALSYTSPVDTVSVSGNVADFWSSVAPGHIYGGTRFHISVTDGGSPGAVHDSYKQDGAPYAITAGNLTVH